MKLPTQLSRTCAAVAATAVIGTLGTDVTSRWYRHLDKPTWQPPGAAFGPAWTTLYGLMAVASARTLDRLDEPAERRAFATAFGTNRHPYCVGQNGVVVGQDGRPDCREVVRRQYCELGRPPADGPLGQSRALVLPACAYLPEGPVAARAWAGVSQTSSRSSSVGS